MKEDGKKEKVKKKIDLDSGSDKAIKDEQYQTTKKNIPNRLY